MSPEEESPPGGGVDGDPPFSGHLCKSRNLQKGCDSLAQTQRTKLQHRRARINQQINKEMRMRTGAENLFRATSNHKVKETIALELSYVNSNLQLLKEELEELNSCMEVYQNDSDSISVPMIPLGLKETKELDWAAPLKAVIKEHYKEDENSYEVELKTLVDLRQAMRTPSRNKAGLELLMEYYSQLYFLENRFFSPHHNLGLYFHWYDSLTGVPSHQRALAFEKGSVLFNIGALHTQIGARQDRTTLQGVDCAIEAFQKASGAFNYLKENFSNAPSLDMSSPSLNMLVRLMIAQVQECVFEKVLLLRAQSDFLVYLQLAQEAARVEEVYSLVHQTMAQPHVKDYVPFSWASMVHVKAQHFKALSHYYAAVALCDCPATPEVDFPKHEKTFLQFHVSMPEGPAPSLLLQDQEARRRLGKAHLKKAIIGHEEAMRIHSLCKVLRKMDILQEVLSLAHKRSLGKYSEIDHEEDFFETAEAPDIHPKTHQRPEIKSPNFSKVKVIDIFHRLGPLSVFSAKNKWHATRTVRLVRGANGFGFTLRGDSPVLVAGVIAGGCAAEAGLKEGDYIVSINDQDCRWSKHADVVQLLKVAGEEGVTVGVITLLPPEGQSAKVDKKPTAATSGAGSVLKSNKENSRKTPLPSKASGGLLAWGRKTKRSKSCGSATLPFTVGDNTLTH
ncbi:rhophilin-1 isoform X1 [Erythrolamprus reginae]|uniref:rhophilin-1 isoform X1 n=1 Tax=Erythrolamprus reginae TaxID=121349 RepID=UPI00396C456A